MLKFVAIILSVAFVSAAVASEYDDTDDFELRKFVSNQINILALHPENCLLSSLDCFLHVITRHFPYTLYKIKRRANHSRTPFRAKRCGRNPNKSFQFHCTRISITLPIKLTLCTICEKKQLFSDNMWIEFKYDFFLISYLVVLSILLNHCRTIYFVSLYSVDDIVENWFLFCLKAFCRYKT